jgi:hypothetical protein
MAGPLLLLYDFLERAIPASLWTTFTLHVVCHTYDVFKFLVT